MTHPDALPRLVIAMSGGVDSSAAAWLLRQAGHELVGLFMRNGVHVEEHEVPKKACCSVSDARDARMIAAQMGIPFQSVDLKDEFKTIIQYFLREYSRGRTPNPCAVCNRDLKFDRLIRFARELGLEGVATGHYARIERVDGRVELHRGLDETKDQSYQLFCVKEENLARTWLPLGGMRKSEVRRVAQAAGLRTAAKKDSQEICFVPSNDYRNLLQQESVTLHPGELVDTSGRVLGTHAGTEHFTIGQRRGHGVSAGEPLYVVELSPQTGRVVLGSREECEQHEMLVEDLNWIGYELGLNAELRCAVQHRYRGEAAAASVVRISKNSARVRFDEPQLALTPGQGAAFYLGMRLVGGGWIERALRS